ncbi:hypothetical protein DITRI_Ditri06bG0028300 [Diplodiscus trichospermus]
MASMLRNNSSSTFCLILFTIISLSTFIIAADHQSDVFAKHISPSSLRLKREKLSHLHFYFHDIVSGKNMSSIVVAEAPSTKHSSTFFGAVIIMNDPLTIKPDLNSKMVRRAQGMYASASQSEASFLMVRNFVFTKGKYKGSTLSLLGRNEILSTVREMPIIGGSGIFRFARGYAQAKTYSMDKVQAIVEYNVYVFHY